MFQKYYEMGLSVIYVPHGSKNPAKKDWNKYCEKKADPSEIEAWSRLSAASNGANIGLCLGAANRVPLCCLDGDTERKEILDALPRSPVIKIGRSPRVASIFRWNPKDEMPVRNIFLGTKDSHGKEEAIQVLYTGQQTILPPSIHPDTKKPYFWLTPDTLENFSIEDLPFLTPSIISELAEKYGKAKPLVIGEGGRNNKLVSIISSMRHRGMGDFDIAREIYEYDSNYHNPPLFTDPADSFKAKNEFEAMGCAVRMVHSVTRTLIQKKAISFDPSICLRVEEMPVRKEGNAFKEKAYPKMTGLIGDIAKIIADKAQSRIPNLAIGGAISIMSTLCSNRYRIGDNWSNLYVLNVAPTGAGKSFPFTIAKKLLIEEMGTRFIRSAGAQSSGGLTKNLVSQPIRLELIDEVSSFFLKMREGGVFQAEMMETLCSLWSSSRELFLSPAYSEKEDTGSCFNPCVNILAATTPEGFKESVDKIMITKGLMPRFLIFTQLGYGESQDGFTNTTLLSQTAKNLKLIEAVPYNKVAGNKLYGDKYNPFDLSTPTVLKAINSYDKELYKMIRSCEDIRRDFYTRGSEMVSRLAILHCISSGRTEASLSDVDWGVGVFEASCHNMTLLMDSVPMERTQFDKDLNKVVELLKSSGSISRSLLMNRSRLPLPRLNQVIDFLGGSSQIMAQADEKGKNGKSTLVYYWL